jgi:hypothetical protein
LDTQGERTAKTEKEILEVQAKFRRRILSQKERDEMVDFLHAYLTIANEAKEKYGESFMIVYPGGESEPSQLVSRSICFLDQNLRLRKFDPPLLSPSC